MKKMTLVKVTNNNNAGFSIYLGDALMADVYTEVTEEVFMAELERVFNQEMIEAERAAVIKAIKRVKKTFEEK